jgi:beta-phosphoglucomutase
MIRAVFFDLDGTLVQTEKLKAMSYAKAAVELRPELHEDDVVEAFKDVVGRSRKDAATTLLERFDLEGPARARMEELDAPSPWEAYAAVRLRYYGEMTHDPEVLRRNRWPRVIELLERAVDAGCVTALATTSHRDQTERVLDALGVRHAFRRIAAYEDVERTKPDPEIYHLLRRELGVEREECLTLEDSPSGVRAGLAAGILVVGLATPFTRQKLEEADLLPRERVAWDLDEVASVVRAAAPRACLWGNGDASGA